MELLEVKEYENYSHKTHKENFESVPVINAKDTSYEQFFESFLLTNQACLIKNIGTFWESSQNWVAEGSPNFTYLNSSYGNFSVSVQNCNEKYYNSQLASKWIFKDYLVYWQNFITNKYSNNLPLYYLKDWHLKNQVPHENFYQVPIYFASDWLNEYLIENLLDDYRFVYMGPQNTWTPFHADVMTSYSWSTNICGKKRWLLLPPGEENKLRDSLHNLPYDITNLNLGCKIFELIQYPGEAIFVPSNWHHQVWNLKDTISINHNWINACNIHLVWDAIHKALQDVKKEIDDCKDSDDFISNCQIILKSSFGMNYEEFYKFVSYIAIKRVRSLENDDTIVIAANQILGHNHAIYDLKSLERLCKIWLKNEDVQMLDLYVEVENLLIKIESALKIL